MKMGQKYFAHVSKGDSGLHQAEGDATTAVEKQVLSADVHQNAGTKASGVWSWSTAGPKKSHFHGIGVIRLGVGRSRWVPLESLSLERHRDGQGRSKQKHKKESHPNLGHRVENLRYSAGKDIICKTSKWPAGSRLPRNSSFASSLLSTSGCAAPHVTGATLPISLST